ncbi:outer membrane protein assembly factor BamA [Sulfurimonas sp.]|uniref:outer membrane protein assembly factor BamA n=1 Tax=Sulfurimonas sp. TaxID=2022749 RepID=UPI002B45FF59|nr:outer membrane protein assembly factor BamA [Sulfurimonas sp.]
MRNFLAILLILLSINLSAITIKSISYEGMVHISKPVALRMLDFEVNDNINEKILDKAIKKYFKQGYFTDIWIEFNAGNLTFHFKEKAIISKVELEGWKENDKDILDSVIQIKKGSLYDKKKLLAAKKRIIEAISQDGKIDSVVEIKEEHLDNGSIKIIFIANEGEEIIIENLEYSGVKNLDVDIFDEVIANKEHQFMGWLWGRNSGDMKLSDLAYDPLRIRDMYMQHGYLDATVDEPFVRVNFDHYTAQMSYQIEEGEVYTISKISLHQVDEVVDDKKIREIIELEKGEPFNIKTFRDDAQKIKTLIADLSYAFVQVTPDLRKNKKDQTVEVIFKITPGDKVKIRNVVISGNTRTLDRIVRRELYLGPGDMYSLTDLKDSRNSLGRLGYFEGNTIEEQRIDNSTMDLVVKLKEAPTGNIQIGGGYGSYGGLLVTLAVNDRNIWGSGINMGVKIERSGKTNNYSYNISNSRLNDSDFSGNFSVYMSDIEYNDYDVSTLGTGVGVGHRFSRSISGYMGYNYSKNDYTLHDVLSVDENNNTVNYYFESYAKSAITISANFDNTDDYYLPREGFAFKQSFEKSGLGGDANFFKSRTTFGKYNGLEDYIGFDAIFRYKARFYFAADTGYLPIAERFYMGGLGSVRGYESYSISPRIKESDGKDRLIGGTQTFSNNFELSLPLVPKAKMRLVAFFDWGLIGGESLSEFSRGGYGLGLEWFSPVGPVQLMFARPLNVQPGDRTSSFEFTMGQRF